MALDVAFALNTNIIELIGLRDAITGAYINNATVSVVDIDHEDGDPVGAVSGSPITMTYQSGTDGTYRGVIPADLPLVAGECYVAVIEADGGVDRFGRWDFKFKVLRRTVR